MKKLLAFITLFLVLGGVANAEYSSWDCKKINNDKYKCLSKISSEKYNATAEYVGQIKNLKRLRIYLQHWMRFHQMLDFQQQ